jgi:Ca2+-binding EF-hand superfamily protein
MADMSEKKTADDEAIKQPKVLADSSTDDNAAELKAKVKKLVGEKYQGDYKKAFDHYGADGVVTRAGVLSLLKDAGVGNGMTRGMWADGIIDKMDASKDGKIQWSEFEAGVR